MTVSGHIVFDERGRRKAQGHPIFSMVAATTLVDVPAVSPASVARSTSWEYDVLGRVTKLTTPSDPEDIEDSFVETLSIATTP